MKRTNPTPPTADPEAERPARVSENPTTIVVVIDRSGSMEPLRGFVVEGVNTLLAGLDPTDRVTLVQFDTTDPYELLVDDQPASEVAPIAYDRYAPRHSTPLWDAVGEAIVRTTEQLDRALARGERVEEPDPGVMLAIVSDGQENSSKRFGGGEIRRMIERRQAAGWRVTYMGLGNDAFDEASRLGIRHQYAGEHEHTAVGTLRAFEDLGVVAGETRDRRPIRGT